MGGKETTGTPIGRPLLDACQSPPGVATGAPSRRSGEGEGEIGGGGGGWINVGVRVRGEGD